MPTLPASIGVLQVDGYSALSKLADRGEVELAFCWVHMGRNFYELANRDIDQLLPWIYRGQSLKAVA